MDNAFFGSSLLLTGVDRVCVPVSPEQSVFIQGEGEGVRQLSFHHHLPENDRGQFWS